MTWVRDITTGREIFQARAAAFEAEAEAEDEPLRVFDPTAASFVRFFDSQPQPRRWIVEDFLPMGVVGALGATGGAGKSAFIYQLGISVASGLPFFGMPIGEPGGFVYLSAEDPENELHGRGLRFLEALERAEKRRVDRDLLRRLIVVDRVGTDNLLTRADEVREVNPTALVDAIIRDAAQVPDLRVIVVDPISRFRGGQANAEEDTTRFVEALERIRAETGATVLGLAHVNKTGIREGGGQEIFRGSSALVDGFRWAATLQRLRRDESKRYGVHPDDSDRYLRLELPKANYVPPFAPRWLYKEAGGVLTPTELVAEDEESLAEKEYIPILKRIGNLLQEEGPMSLRRLRGYARTDGPLQRSDKVVREVVDRALRCGDLVKNGNDIDTPGGAP